MKLPTSQVISSSLLLEQAYTWVCAQRDERSHNNSIWDLRYRWPTIKPLLQEKLRTGTYALSPVQSYYIHGEWVSSWNALDALVLKALALTLQPLFSPIHYPHCMHVKNAGGIHAAIKHVSRHQDSYQHILKSDAYHYYESIDHDVLLEALKEHVSCPILINLVEQYCQRVEIKDGQYYHFKRGIPMGCPLSPLMSALYLKPLDDALCKHGFYVRFMDDWVIMVKTKHQLRKVIRLTHQILDKLKLKMHPDKTFLGCIKKGFDFLGVHFGVTPGLSATTLERHQTKLAQRYAQGASSACIGDYVARWTSWCTSVLKSMCKTTEDYQSMTPADDTGAKRHAHTKENIHGQQWVRHVA
ncbi:MAG: hypothetical protein GW760_06135 [Legionella sp.]|nr:hypothetical protein [Legionella sp.]